MRPPLKLKPQVRAVAYLVEIPNEDLMRLENDLYAFDELDEVSGIYDIDYSPHFGNHVVFTASDDTARDEFLVVLRKVLLRLRRRKQ